MEDAGQLSAITNATQLEQHRQLWEQRFASRSTAQTVGQASCPNQNGSPPAIGYVLSLEGADSLITLNHLERAYSQGLRALGPAHYGPGTYAQGTDATGGLGPRGKELLVEMARLGFILDATHLCDESFWEAVNLFNGPIWASHSNCRALVPHHRQFTDEQIKALIARGAVIGVALDGWMLVPGWVKKTTTPQSAGLKLERVVEHIDHICQIAGNAQHVGIGSDLDGGFGREQTPADLDTIADLARLPDMLRLPRGGRARCRAREFHPVPSKRLEAKPGLMLLGLRKQLQGLNHGIMARDGFESHLDDSIAGSNSGKLAHIRFEDAGLVSHV
jgi:membrane dipeptidase